MLVLLPPSEGKARPAQGAPADLAALAFGELTPRRERLLDLLEAMGSRPPKRALAALALSPGQADEIVYNAVLRTAPAAPAHAIYTGVLYERLRLPDLDASAREHVLIASALWGAVRPDDHIPAYRLSMGAKLPRIPNLAAWWRPHLVKALPDDGLVIDLRSGAYVAAFRPKRATVLGVRGLTEHADGRRTVISHMAKRVRGDVARVLLQAPRTPDGADEVVDLVAAAGMRVERTADGIDVIEPAAAAA